MKWRTVARWRVRWERTAEWNALQQEEEEEFGSSLLQGFIILLHIDVRPWNTSTYEVYSKSLRTWLWPIMRQMHLKSVVWKRFAA